MGGKGEQEQRESPNFGWMLVCVALIVFGLALRGDLGALLDLLDGLL